MLGKSQMRRLDAWRIGSRGPEPSGFQTCPRVPRLRPRARRDEDDLAGRFAQPPAEPIESEGQADQQTGDDDEGSHSDQDQALTDLGSDLALFLGGKSSHGGSVPDRAGLESVGQQADSQGRLLANLASIWGRVVARPATPSGVGDHSFD
jgi:hypothetical protein